MQSVMVMMGQLIQTIMLINFKCGMAILLAWNRAKLGHYGSYAFEEDLLNCCRASE